MLELHDIQGLVTTGYAHQPHARFLFLQIQNREQAQTWLEGVIPSITTAARRPEGAPKPHTSVHIAFTALGLLALGLNDDAMQTFPREFTVGMGNAERPRVLGDSGESAPEHWQVGGPLNKEVHALLMLYASSEKRLTELTIQQWNPSDGNLGLTEVFRQDTYRAGVNEPFGFRDGVSQPAIEGVEEVVQPGQAVIKAGEFVLGYENEYGQVGSVPTVADEQDVAHILTSDNADGTRKEFGRNGTYLVWRKLAQDVEGFWNFMEERTKNPDGSINPEKKKWLAAKFVGRWPSGAPLTLSPEHDDCELGKDVQRNNDFLYLQKDADGKDDAEGFRCPVGSHVRRSNPRDTLQPNPTRSLVIANRHRILRRGRPYAENPATPGTENTKGKEVGLIFIAINADIQRQFEFIQQTWINSPKFNGLYDNKDPIVGNNNEASDSEDSTNNPGMGNGDAKGSLTIQRYPVRLRVQGIPRFVEVRGGGYFFLPSLQALHFLVALA